MTIKQLEFTNGNLEATIAFRVDALSKGPVDARKVLRLSSELRQLGCGVLLASYDLEGFCQYLFHAADIYLQMLEHKADWPHLDPYYLARSRAQPLLDALALGDLELARRIGQRLEPRWLENMEYEEDYCFFGALPLFASPAMESQAELAQLLERMEHALQGVTYPRFHVLTALLQADAERFEEALLELIAEWRAEMKRQRKSGLGDAVLLRTEAQVFIEGIALVRLAQARGLRTRSQYPLIPPAALGHYTGNLARVKLWG